MKQQPQFPPVSFASNYDREKGQPFGYTSFLVVIPDETLVGLTQDHPARWLKARFNGCATPHMRVQCLADALRELEARQLVRDNTPGGWFARLIGRLLQGQYATAFIIGLLAGAAFGALVALVFFVR